MRPRRASLRAPALASLSCRPPIPLLSPSPQRTIDAWEWWPQVDLRYGFRIAWMVQDVLVRLSRTRPERQRTTLRSNRCSSPIGGMQRTPTAQQNRSTAPVPRPGALVRRPPPDPPRVTEAAPDDAAPPPADTPQFRPIVPAEAQPSALTWAAGEEGAWLPLRAPVPCTSLLGSGDPDLLLKPAEQRDRSLFSRTSRDQPSLLILSRRHDAVSSGARDDCVSLHALSMAQPARHSTRD